MSVSNMKKLTVFAHRDEVDDLLRRLVHLRCVEFRTLEPPKGRLSMVRCNFDAQRSELEASLSQIGEALAVLSPCSQKKRSLIRPKQKIRFDDFRADGSEARARETVSRALRIAARKNEVKLEEARARAKIYAAFPYRSYDLPLGFSETEKTDLLLGVIPAKTDLETLGKKLYSAGAVAELISENLGGKYISVIFCKNDAESVGTVLSEYGFVRASFRGVEQTAEEQLLEAEATIHRLLKERGDLNQELIRLAESMEEVEVLYDLEATELTATIQKQKMVASERTVMLCGWVPERTEERVSELLEKYACAYEISVPDPDDKPPVFLQNNRFAENFEWVLEMYSYPAYGRFDPTLIMSIFYFIIFGIMFADAGYGLILMLACFGGVKLLKPGKGMERFLKMFGYCGISCVIFGVLFGAYFGDLPLAIMRNMMGMSEEQLPNLALLGSSAPNVALLFDPLQNPMGFLVVSLAVGAIHLIAGMAVRFVILCKEGQALDAILDIGLYWLLFAGIGLIFLFPTVGLWTTVAAAVLIVLTHGRAEKNLVMKLLKGLLGIYDLISYASDLLSYSRILALGLAAGVIGQVVNILGTMGGPTVVGFFALIVAFAIGHLLNIAINVLGTFVHTSRLQYIEFFNKFYEDGGVPFEPAVPSDKYTEE
ncbi:MAG: V-type ATP synthase subunit I [Clostridia bacterium]|nr:V-type ATP synthase subunit I [Clostridia bacterium]